MAGIQIMGLVSGLDVNGAIDKLLEIERLPISRIAARKSIYKTQQDAWRDINTRLSALDNTLTPLKLTSTFQGRTAVVGEPGVVGASANSQAIAGSYEVVVGQRALAHRIASTEGLDPDYATAEDATLFITTGSDPGSATEISIAAGSKLEDILVTINNSAAPARATVIGGRLVLESAETGTDHALSLTDDGTSGLLSELKLMVGGEGPSQLNTVQQARNAEFSVNGVQLTSQSNTVQDAVRGLTLTLLKDDSTTAVTVKRDSDTAMAKIKDFVAQYNSVMSFISEKTKVTMTDAGKIASTGTLQGDGTANRLRDALRSRTTAALTGDQELDIDQLAVLGITTDKEGILQIDEGKLRSALEEKPEAVAAFFNQKATNLQGFIKGYVQYGTGILAEKQDSIGRLIADVDRQIERLEERVARKEESLTRQFTALEKTLSSIYAQGDWLAQQMDMLSSWSVPQRRR